MCARRFLAVLPSAGLSGVHCGRYLDSTPTHSYMKMLYKYPMDAYPYGLLVAQNKGRTRTDPEFELYDAMPRTWKLNHYFDVFVEYAKVRSCTVRHSVYFGAHTFTVMYMCVCRAVKTTYCAPSRP